MGERVTRRLALPVLLRDRDLLELMDRLRFLMSVRESLESAPDEVERLRRRSRTGLTDMELERERRRRRGGVRDRDRSLGAGELDLVLNGGELEREVCLGRLLLSLGDLSLLRLAGGDLLREGERRRTRRGGDLERSVDGERRVRRLGGGDREGSDDSERRVRRGGGDAERLPEGERRRSRDLSRRPPRPRPRPPPGM